MSNVIPFRAAGRPTAELIVRVLPPPLAPAHLRASNYAAALWLALDPQARAMVFPSHAPAIVPQAPDAAPPPQPGIHEDTEAVFRCDGDFWTISYEARTIRLRDSRGLCYLAVLLAHPGRRLHVHEIVRVVAGGDGRSGFPPCSTLTARSDLGDAGPALDARARAEYCTRLIQLEDEMEEAERTNDLGRRTTLRDEIEMISHELLEAARGRKAASHVERARIAVTKGIKTALVRIAERHPDLGHHLFATVRRGYSCVYQPDPRRPIDWHCSPVEGRR